MQSERGAVMQIHLLDTAGARELYATRMVRDFPPEELKPFTSIEELLNAGLYEPLTFADDAGAVVAYAWQVILPGAASGLVDYFAVRSDLRGSGIGTRALQLLREYYAPRLAALQLEVEHPAEAPDPAAARWRIGFYLRAGARATALESRVFGVRYQILQLPCGEALPDAVLNRELQALYRRMIPQPYYRGNVIFYGN